MIKINGFIHTIDIDKNLLYITVCKDDYLKFMNHLESFGDVDYFPRTQQYFRISLKNYFADQTDKKIIKVYKK